MVQFVDIAWAVGKHLAFGYVVYSLLERSQGRVPDLETAALLFGVVVPDLVDKPLVFLGVLSYGRSFAHSLFTASILVATVYLVTHRLDRGDLGRAFGLGYVLHLPVDLYGPMLTGHHPIDTAFLFWPIAVDRSLGVMPPALPVAKRTVFSIVMIGAVALWIADGLPIVSDVANRLGLRPYD